MAVYTTSRPLMSPDEAQAVLDHHPGDAATGLCQGCEGRVPVEDCVPRLGALSALWLAQRLPRRRPMATNPERIGLTRLRVR